MPHLHASWTRAGTVDISSQFGALTAMGTAIQKPDSLLSARSIQLFMRYALIPLNLVRRGFQWSPVEWCNECTEAGSVFLDGELTSMYASFSFGPQALSINSTGKSQGMQAARIVALPELAALVLNTLLIIGVTFSPVGRRWQSERNNQ